MSLIEELLSLLQPVFFWLANILEFYHFLTTRQSSLNLVPPFSPDTEAVTNGDTETKQTNEEENPLVTLQNVMVYVFQQAFYPVSKVIHHFLALWSRVQWLNSLASITVAVGLKSVAVIDRCSCFVKQLCYVVL